MKTFIRKQFYSFLLVLVYLLYFLPPNLVSHNIKCDTEWNTPEAALKYLMDKSAKGMSDEKVVKILLGCKGHFNYTYHQLEQFFKQREDSFVNATARNVPLCVLTEDIDTSIPELGRFKEVFKKLDKDEEEARKNKPHKELLKVWSDTQKIAGLEKIEFRKIETPSTVYTTQKKLYLNQWINVRLYFNEDMDGIIVQSIEGFLGIPFGNFRNDFNCKGTADTLNNDTLNTNDYGDMGIIPCKYRPRHSLVHPQILSVGGNNNKQHKKYKDFIFHFNWINIQCSEVAAFQFLIIAIKDAPKASFDSFLTPVYEIKTFDTFDGVPTYYYPDPRPEWTDKITCAPPPPPPPVPIPLKTTTTNRPTTNQTTTNQTTSNQTTSNQITSNQTTTNVTQPRPRPPTKCLPKSTYCTSSKSCKLGFIDACDKSVIPYSRTYDNCVTRKTSVDGKTCPPGPFSCSKSPKTIQAWTEARETNIITLRDCFKYMPRKDKCKFNPATNSTRNPNFWNHDAPIPQNSSGGLLLITPRVQVGRRRKKRMAPNYAQNDESFDMHPTVASVQQPRSGVSGEKVQYAQNKRVREEFMKEYEKLGVQRYKFNKRLHGFLMIVAFLVINPISTLLARYFKETPLVCCCGVPSWLMFHIILTSISITIMWLGIVTSLGNAGRGVVNCNKLVLKSDLNTKCSDHQNVLVHFFLGIVTVTAFHLSALSGWTRPKHSKGVYMTSHSFAGYFTFFGAAASGIFVNASTCIEIKCEVMLLFIINILMWSMECCCQCLQDKRMRVKERHLFPILEGIQIHRGSSPPCHFMKILVLLIAVFLHLLMGTIIFLSYVVINDQDIYVDRSNLTQVTFDVEGLFFKKCTIVNYAMLQEEEKRENGMNIGGEE